MRYLLLLSLFSLFSCYETTRNCNDYKTGTFRFDYVVNNISKSATFKRTKNHSINYYDKKTDSSEVKWINNCEFILYKLNPKSISEKDPIPSIYSLLLLLIEYLVISISTSIFSSSLL